VPKTTIRIILGIIMMLGLIVSVSACKEEPGIEVGDEREYADPIAEDILIGMNENDYAKFSQHFDEAMKDATPETNFVQLSAALKQIIGDYVSKEFWKVEEQDIYTIVYYKAKYTKEPGDVEVKVVFHEIEGEMYVSGLWFDSPKLREQ